MDWNDRQKEKKIYRHTKMEKPIQWDKVFRLYLRWFFSIIIIFEIECRVISKLRSSLSHLEVLWLNDQRKCQKVNLNTYIINNKQNFEFFFTSSEKFQIIWNYHNFDTKIHCVNGEIINVLYLIKLNLWIELSNNICW